MVRRLARGMPSIKLRMNFKQLQWLRERERPLSPLLAWHRRQHGGNMAGMSHPSLSISYIPGVGRFNPVPVPTTAVLPASPRAALPPRLPQRLIYSYPFIVRFQVSHPRQNACHTGLQRHYHAPEPLPLLPGRTPAALL